jgi:hypothetical protein
MSEIPFIKALGDALDTAMATSTRDSARSRRPLRFLRPRRRLALALIGLAVIVAGGATADSLLLGSSQRLAAGTVNCFFTTHGKAISLKTPGAGGEPSNGKSPIAVCRRWYGLNAHTGRNAADVKFVACRQAPTVVAVFVASGRANQCQSLGLAPLPQTYPAGATSIRTLIRALATLQHEHDCVSPTALAGEVRATLKRLGFASWRAAVPPAHPPIDAKIPGHAKIPYAQLEPPSGTGGTCGELVSNPPSSSVSLNARKRAVMISTGPPNSIARLLNHVSYELYTRTYEHCFTSTSVRALVLRAFAASPLRPRFATTAAFPPGVKYEPHSQLLYDNGCVRFEVANPGNDERYVDVWLFARGAPPLPAHLLHPQANAFRP